MIKECKKCGSKNLYLESLIKGQDVMTANMVALKCKDCDSWLKWCSKDERKYYYANTQQKQDTKWQKLKEWVKENKYKQLDDRYIDKLVDVVDVNCLLDKMQELEGEYE